VRKQLFFLFLMSAISVTSFGQTGAEEFHGNRKRDKDVPVTVFQAAGPNAASIQSTVDQFRAAVSGVNNVNNGNQAGPLANGRREINWDGGSTTNTATSLGATPFDVFLNTRGNRSITPGTGFVQAPASGLADTFGNPSYANIFKTFSPSRLFSPIGVMSPTQFSLSLAQRPVQRDQHRQ